MPANAAGKFCVKVTKDGPYVVTGGLPVAKDVIVTDDAGNSVGWRTAESYPVKPSYALCRCGLSKAKPFCDGTHAKAGFDGTETASHDKYNEQAERIEGPGLVLSDAIGLCAIARFCHNKDGNVWALTRDSGDSKSRDAAIRQACDCPSGRLVASDARTGKPIEPELEPSISIIEDPKLGVSGPIWLKGGVRVESADGTAYETRNRVTLCRCGQSKNKPFCDGCHVDAGFNDGDPSLRRTRRAP